MGGSIMRCISVLHSGRSLVWKTGGRRRGVGFIDVVRSNTISGDSAANYVPLEIRYCIGVTPVCIAVVTASALPRLKHARPPHGMYLMHWTTCLERQAIYSCLTVDYTLKTFGGSGLEMIAHLFLTLL